MMNVANEQRDERTRERERAEMPHTDVSSLYSSLSHVSLCETRQEFGTETRCQMAIGCTAIRGVCAIGRRGRHGRADELLETT